MSALDISARAGRKAFAAAEQAWSRLWFQERPTTPLELVRIGIGAALLAPLPQRQFLSARILG